MGKMYVGVSNVARNVKDIYVGVNGVARKVVKGYVGVNGVAQLFWGGSSGYTGVRLFFDYDYEPNQTYQRNTASIIDTIDYLIEKNLQIAKTSDGESLMQTVKNNKAEILDYVSGLLISTDDTVQIYTSISFGSGYAGGSRCQISLNIGQSSLSQITAGNWSKDIYPNMVNQESEQGYTRLYLVISCFGDGTLTKTSQSYSQRISIQTGQNAEQFGSSNKYFNYIYTLTNIGVHFGTFSSGNIIANFDYTQSYYDTVDGLDGYSNRASSTRDSQGLHKRDNTYIYLPIWLLHYGNAIEMTIGTMSYPSSSVPTLIYFSGTNVTQIGLTYYESRNTWSLVRLNTYDDLNISDFHYFDNSTVKMSYGSDGKVSVYKNGVLVHQSSMTYDPTNIDSRIGLLRNMQGTVTKVRVLSWHKIIYSTVYPNANIDISGTVSTNNGTRTPVTKPNAGDGIVFISMNGLGSSWGGNWIVTCCIALSYNEALLTAVGTGTDPNVTSHTINGKTYWIGLQATNASWGGGTQVGNPLDVPVFQDLYICEVNASPTTAKVEELIQLFDIQTS